MTECHLTFVDRLDQQAPTVTLWPFHTRYRGTPPKFRQSLQYTVAPGVFAIGNNNKSSRVEVTPWEDGDPRHAAYYIVSGLYPILALKDGQGNEVRLTRVTGQAAPYKDITNAPR